MTPPAPTRPLASGLVALLAAGALLLGGTPALAEDAPLTSTREDPGAPLSATREDAPELTPSADAAAQASGQYYNALVGGEELARGERITSERDGGWRFEMQTDGNAVIYDPSGRATFGTGTEGRGDHLVMQADGNLVVYSSGGRPVWNTVTPDEPNAAVIIQEDGNLVVYRENGTPAWASSVNGRIAEPPIDTLFAGQTLRANRQLTSENGRFTARMQDDGNLVGYGPQGVVWNTGIRGAGNRLVLQEDGNAVVYGADGSVRWSSDTRGTDLRLGITNAGSLIIVNQDGSIIWTSQAALPSSTLYATNGLDAGSLLRSPNGAYRALMQADGNFVVYGPSGPVYSTGTSSAGSAFVLYDDGVMAVVTRDGSVTWSASASPSSVAPYRLVLQDDGNLVQYDGRGAPSWSIR
ncbi:hypothetical protein [Rathayibacter tanaceti]|uniref:D-mannose binding lectin n=2 Tax=Rathayibacter tanaceti TaxID=1671680 RepID=A0A166D7N5_9MICO|nr:hypothetical protein [Rathayibacter tanaceti]KZX22137.1 D-mannose binding lectin [Rathayibacter tanaceti]QHC54478.1 hypothetical protein GSU10_01570 [Rathayibacter tanaceti]TCO35033.1 D-mannose binding lectin [Rathayibacter tanaceti]